MPQITNIPDYLTAHGIFIPNDLPFEGPNSELLFKIDLDNHQVVIPSTMALVDENGDPLSGGGGSISAPAGEIVFGDAMGTGVTSSPSFKWDSTNGIVMDTCLQFTAAGFDNNGKGGWANDTVGGGLCPLGANGGMFWGAVTDGTVSAIGIELNVAGVAINTEPLFYLTTGESIAGGVGIGGPVTMFGIDVDYNHFESGAFLFTVKDQLNLGNRSNVGFVGVNTPASGPSAIFHAINPTTESGDAAKNYPVVFIEGRADQVSNLLTMKLTGGADLFTVSPTGVLGLAVSAAPASPADGQIWLESNTNTGLKVRINGVTKTVTLG